MQKKLLAIYKSLESTRGAKLMEEIGELLIAYSKQDWENAFEEMADVMCIIRQFDVAMDGVITEVMERKVDRTIERYGIKCVGCVWGWLEIILALGVFSVITYD